MTSCDGREIPVALELTARGALSDDLALQYSIVYEKYKSFRFMFNKLHCVVEIDLVCGIEIEAGD